MVDIGTNLPPFGTLKSGATRTTAPSASGMPRVSTSLMKGPIWRSGSFTTAHTCRPQQPVRMIMHRQLGRRLLHPDLPAEVDGELDRGFPGLGKGCASMMVPTRMSTVSKSE